MKPTNIGISKRLFKPVFIGIITAVLAIVCFLLYSYKTEMEAVNNGQVQSLSLNMDTSIRKDAEAYISNLQYLLDNEHIIEAWKQRDREKLYKLALPIYNKLHKNLRVTHLYFHDINKYNFLRVHRPDDFGDYITRDTLKNSAESRAVFWGLEIGVYGWHVLRVVMPWVVDGELIGYLELGEEIVHLMTEVNSIYNVNGLILIDKDKITKNKWLLTHPNANYGWETLDKYIVFSTSFSRKPIGVSDMLSDRKISASMTPFYTLKGNRLIRVSSVPIVSANGYIESYNIILFDMTGSMTRAISVFGTLTLAILLMGIILAKSFLRKTKDIDAELNNIYSQLNTKINEQKIYEEKLTHSAYYDSLTGLPNRSLILNRLNKAIGSCGRRNSLGALIFIDLDFFKKINDSYGHAIGDEVLKHVGRRIKDNIRSSDTASRLGGDEFLIVLPDTYREKEDSHISIGHFAENIRSLFETPFYVEGQKFNINVSMGISLFPNDSCDSSDLIKFADSAMYKAKESGRNSIRFFEPSMQEKINKRIELEKDLKSAIENSEFFLEYQPKYNKERVIVGSEALVRWQHPKRGRVPPDEFISLSEDLGLIVEMSHWIINAAMLTVKQIHDALNDKSFSMAINISPIHFHDPCFPEYIEEIANNHGLKNRSIILEITEGVMIEDINEIKIRIKKLKEIGFNVSVDDFGTGYSSLAYLKDLDINELKIDRAFVNDIDSGGTAIVEAIISMSKHLNLNIVAEGVENELQLKFLNDRDCDIYQGFYLSRPVNKASLFDLLGISNQ